MILIATSCSLAILYMNSRYLLSLYVLFSQQFLFVSHIKMPDKQNHYINDRPYAIQPMSIYMFSEKKGFSCAKMRENV